MWRAPEKHALAKRKDKRAKNRAACWRWDDAEGLSSTLKPKAGKAFPASPISGRRLLL